MKHSRSGRLALLTCPLLLAMANPNCPSPPGGYTPTWVTASWLGGITGSPTDRMNRAATQNNDRICPPTSLLLSIGTGGFQGLTVVNNCESIVTYYLCATAGQTNEPQGGLNVCASDALQTPLSRLTVITLRPGGPGQGINSSRDLSVQVFWCGESTRLVGPPLKCR